MSTNKILLTYASLYGSTKEVAENIASSLRNTGLEVDMRPIQEVKSVADYRAIVLGAAIYNARWHADAHLFLSQYQETLRQLPLAIFALGPLNKNNVSMQRSRRQLDKELEKYPWLKPVALEMFVGKYDTSKLGFFERLTPSSDNRDWEAIRAWANALPAQLSIDKVAQSD